MSFPGQFKMDNAAIRNETGRYRMGKRVVASYCSSFLKSEMLHIYRQLRALRGVDTFVVTKEVQNAERFPFERIEIIPKRRTNLLVHGWLKFVERRPPIVYRGEYQTLDSLLERHGADLMHIYFGHTGVHLLPFIEQWDKPCVVSFHGADVALKQDVKDYPEMLRRVCARLRFSRRTIRRRSFSLQAKGHCSRNWKCSPPALGFTQTCTLSVFCRNRNCWTFMQARTCFCIRAKRLQITTSKVCRTRFWKRWRPACLWQRRGMAESRKRSIMAELGGWYLRRITSPWRTPCKKSHIRLASSPRWDCARAKP